jgi:hypothetical protein
MKGNRIYVSIDDNAPGVIPWVINELEPRLMQAGYYVFLPCRDVEPGSIYHREIIKEIPASRDFIIVLICEYSTLKHTEWKCIWSEYSNDSETKIGFVNFDLLNMPRAFSNSLKAAFRLGLPIDFANMGKTIYAEIIGKLKRSSKIKTMNDTKLDKNISVVNMFYRDELELNEMNVDVLNVDVPSIELTTAGTHVNICIKDV